MIANVRSKSPYLTGCWIILACLMTGCLAGCQQVGLLNPKGIIAFQERKLFFDTLALMLIVVLPVIIMSFAFAYHYRASHRTSDYKPNWSHNHFLEMLWWSIPCVIIVVLAVLTWKKTYELDPYRTIPGQAKPPMLIQVIGLPWKWLFIYPEQHIATVNYLEIPVNRQVEFWMTVDNVPMSSFFISQLGSQIYAMAGMRTRLHLIANETGVFDGMNNQFNGEGFSWMHFPVHVVTDDEMQRWVSEVKHSHQSLTDAAYDALLYPKLGQAPAEYYSNVTPELFNHVLDVYMNSTGPNHPRINHGHFVG